MAPTRIPRCTLLLILLLMVASSSAQLSMELKQYLLDSHNGARRAQPAGNMRAMEWITSLAVQAERIASDCTDSPPDQSSLISSLNNQYSWIGVNKHFINTSTSSGSITISHTRQSFECWYNGASTGNCQSTDTNRQQLLYPDTHIIGCGAKYFSESERCHILGTGVLVVCLYAPGLVSGFTLSTGVSCTSCPPVAPHCVDGLCASNTSIPQVPTDVTGGNNEETDEPIIYYTSGRYGSYAGGTLIYFNGRYFSKDQFNRDNPNLGNTVVFTDGVSNITCDVVTYYTTTTRIGCVIGAAPRRVQSSFRPIVTVDGKAIPRSRTCPNGDVHCTFTYYEWATPYIDRVSPEAMVAGDDRAVTMIGRIYTYKVSETQEVVENVHPSYLQWNLDRLLVGGEQCDPYTDDDQTTPYGGHLTAWWGYGNVTCRPEATRVDSMNATIVLSSYGLSQVNIDKFSIDNKLRQYIFQTHSDITSVEPNSGSTEGGTMITIYGHNLYDPDSNVKAYISGVACEIVNYTNSYITCVTGPSPPTASVYPGGRGLAREVWTTGFTTNLNTVESRGYGYPTSDNWSIQERAYRDSSYPPEFGEVFLLNQRYTGFFVPPIDSYYTFNANCDDGCRLYLSPNASRESKQLVAYITGHTSSWDQIPSQISEPHYLKAGESYYLEAVQLQGYGPWRIGIGAKIHNLSWTEDVADIDYEEQIINIRSTVVKETQSLTIMATPKIQGISIELDDTVSNYTLTFNGQTTPSLSFTDNDTIINEALNSLESVKSAGGLLVYINTSNDDTLELSVLFLSTQSSQLLVEVSNNINSSSYISQELSVPDTFTLSFGSRTTPSLPTDIPPLNISQAVTDLFSTKCTVTSPGQVFFKDSYDVMLTRQSSYGTLDSSVEPYCGRYSLKNPTNLYRYDRTRDERTKTLTDGPAVLSPFGYRYACFAYLGPLPQSRLRVVARINPTSTQTTSITLTVADDVTKWNYMCVDMYEALHDRYNNASGIYTVTHVRFNTPSTDFWIDEFTITTSSKTQIQQSVMAVRPNGVFVDTVTVTTRSLPSHQQPYCPDQSDLSSCLLPFTGYTLEYQAHSCGYGMPLISSSSSTRVSRVLAGSPPVTGTFNLMFEDQVVYNLSAVLTAQDMETMLEAGLPNDGDFTVTRDGDCKGYSWTVKWNKRPGDHPLMVSDGRGLIGHMVEVGVVRSVDGGVWMRPLRGDMLRLPELVPQVQVIVNDIPASCRSSNCSFTFSTDSTPVINGISPSSGGQDATPVLIYGSNFGDDATKATVTIGNSSCVVLMLNESVIKCRPEASAAGVKRVSVHIDGVGYAQGNVSFSYTLVLESITPDAGSVSGGYQVLLKGVGFPVVSNTSCYCRTCLPCGPSINDFPNSYVTFGDYPCLITSSTIRELTCIPQPHPPNNVNVSINVNGAMAVLTDEFEYVNDNIAIIGSINPSEGPAIGGTTVTISGQYLLNTTSVSIGGSTCNIVSVSESNIVCMTSRSSPGQRVVIVESNTSFGIALTQSIIDEVYHLTSFTLSQLMDINNTRFHGNHMSVAGALNYTYQLSVTSVTPCSGSLAGDTEVTIKGAGFTQEVSVQLNDGQCTVSGSVQHNELKCTAPSLVGNNYIITNNGTHPVRGRYFAWTPSTIEITQGDSITWQWDGSKFVLPQSFEVHQSSSLTSSSHVSGGFRSSSSVIGNYTYIFTDPGAYYYTTDVNDACLSCYMSGMVTVIPLRDTPATVSVGYDDIEAVYMLEEVENSNCLSCYNTTDKPVYQYSTCDTPTITNIEPATITLQSTITITGTGFGTNSSLTSIMFSDCSCMIQGIYNDTMMTCILSQSCQPIPFTNLALTAHIVNKGTAIILSNNRGVVIRPVITGLSPLNGSLFGGNTLTISGHSFIERPEDLTVSIDSQSCHIRSVSYNTVNCIIPQSLDTSSNSSHVLNVTYSSQGEIPCVTARGGVCYYDYQPEKTPAIDSVHPNVIGGTEKSRIMISGSLLSSSSLVWIGYHECTNVTVDSMDDDTVNISCSMDPIAAGQYTVTVLSPPYGYAMIEEEESTVTSLLRVESLSPAAGSTRGGTELTLTGIGFSTSLTNNSVNISGVPCAVTASSYSSLTCLTPDLNREANTTITVAVSMPYFNNRPRREVRDPLIFEYDIEATPTITSITPGMGQKGDLINIQGMGLSTNSNDVSVMIGSSACSVTVANNSNIECTLGANFVGSYEVDVRIKGKGRASGDQTFTYTLIVSGVSPRNGSFAGLNIMSVQGIGFDPVSTVIRVCDRICSPSSIRPSLTSVSCMIPSFTDLLANDSITDKYCNVTVTSLSNTATISDAYKLSRDLTPYAYSINRTRGGTAGGSLIMIGGNGFNSNVSVTIAGTPCAVREYTSTSIICVTGASGRTVTDRVMVYVEGHGFAVSNVTFEYIDLWSSRYTWGGGSLPAEGDFVIVPSGQTLVLDIRTPVLKILLIQGGSLIFDDNEDGVELHSENILITDGGSLQVGTEAIPYQHKAQIVMYGHRLSTELPLFGAKTLAVRNGTLDLHGKPIKHTWTCLTSTIKPGDTNLTVKHNVSDWEIGGKIVIASTSYSQRENEELTIVSINGNTITVSPAVSYTHVALVQTINGQTIETCGEVGYLTRNVVVRGNRNEEWDIQFADCSKDFKPGQFHVQTCFGGRFGAEVIGDEFGSQIMLHRGPNDKIIGRLEYIEVTHAGQAYRLGRYPIHFHLNGDVSDSYVRGCAIHHTFNRAVTIHAVDNLLVEHNVAYNIKGHAYFLEDGIEIGNIIQYNLGVFVKASSSLLNVDITPATFWSVNPNNTIRHNAAAGGTHFGFWYRLPANPTGPSFTTSVRPVNDPMGQFYNNSAHSFGWYGIWIFREYYPVNDNICNPVTPAVFDTFLSWRNDRGIEFSEVGAVQFKNSVLLDDVVAGVEYTLVKAAWGTSGALVENVLIVAHSGLRDIDDARLRGSPPICTASGIKTPHTYYLTVSNVTFVNFNESGCYAMRACSHCRTPKQGGFESRFEKLSFSNSPNKVYWQWEHEHVFRDMDGSLTGKPGGALLPTSGVLPPTHCRHDDASSMGAVNGSVCDPGIQFVRFAITAPVPTSLTFRNLTVSSTEGSTVLEYVLKRLIHGAGYMAILPTQREYQLDWNDGERFVNISYSSLYSGMSASDYLWITHDFKDVVNGITINNNEINATEQIPPAGQSLLGDWYSNINDTAVTYYVNGTSVSCTPDVPLTFSSYQCFYENCVPPPPPEPVVPRPPGRPNVTQMWSNVSIWPDGALPSPDSDVYIGCDLYVLVDTPIPRLNTLTLCGGLEFLDDRDYVLEANRVLVDGGGQLVAGRSATPFQHNLLIILNGSLSSPEYRLPNLGPVLGAKGLGVFGRLSLHGKERLRSWTVLGQTASPGDRNLKLSEPVDWVPGDGIVIAASYYEIGETEEHVIESVSNDGLTVTLMQSVKYTHLGGRHNTQCCEVNITAEVGLLSRNIKILGTHPNASLDLAKTESYGCRVLVSTYRNGSSFYTGVATLSGVEFKGCGQEGFVEDFDPRFSLSFLNTGTVIDNSSYIRSCSFHSGYSTGIGVFGANNMMISDNVIHRTVGHSLKLSGRGHQIIKNLAVVALFPGTYRIPNEPFNSEWTANYYLIDAVDVMLIGNSAAGGAKAGYHTNGENCLMDGFMPSWRDNVAHSTLHGLHMGYSDGHTSGSLDGCSAFHSFTIYSCYHYGLFSYSGAGLRITDSLFINNYAATFTAVIGPSSLSHLLSNKIIMIQNTRIISSIHPNGGESINCTQYSRRPVIGEHKTSHSGLNRNGAHVGIILTTFTSGKGHFPKSAWYSVTSYPAINGLTRLSNVTFCNFGTHCNDRPEAAIMTHPSSEDCQHPLWMDNVAYEMGSNESKFYNHNPSLSSVNPSDCVDMDCDALKKILIRDLDGTFLGRPGLSSLISRSEFEWDGDRRRGLGDYRIPYAMLARPNGSRINPDIIYPNKGIYRGPAGACQFIPAYNSYSCNGIDHMMLIIESLDADTEVRRLSPVGMGADGYIDLVNGPQDHGWCGGYTCQERISTFYTIVSTGLNYTVGLTSTNPQKTNFILLHASDSQSLRIAYIYNNPQRLDVYVGTEYIVPTNGYFQDGNLRYRRGDNFVPSPTDPIGTNYYDRNEKKLYLVVRGSTPVRVETTPVIQLGIDLPPVTVDEFFETNLIRNLAELLGIQPNRIRIVNVVSEGGTRRKRETARTRVEIEIGNAPSNETVDNNNNNNNGTTGNEYNVTTGGNEGDEVVYQELVNITTQVGVVIQTGELSNKINYTIFDAQVTEPEPIVTDPTGGVRATNITGGPQPGQNGTDMLPTYTEVQKMEEEEKRNETQPINLNIPAELRIVSLPTQGIEGLPLTNPPLTLAMFDGSENRVTTLGVGLPWQLTTYIARKSEGVFLMNDTVDMGMGLALFSSLSISHPGTYQLIFRVTYPSSTDFTVSSSNITIATRQLHLSIVRGPPGTGNTTLPLSDSLIVQVVDNNNDPVTDLGWRNRYWFMTATLVGGTASYANNVSIMGGVAEFPPFRVDAAGSYRIRFSVYTEPMSPSHEIPRPVESDVIIISEYQVTRYTLAYNNSYNDIVSGHEESFIKHFRTQLQTEFPDVHIYNVTVMQGSILVSFFATSSNLNSLLSFIESLPSSRAVNNVTFRNNTLDLISVIQDPEYTPTTIPTEGTTKSSNNQLIITIVSVSVSGVVLLGIVCLTIIIFTYNCVKIKQRKKNYRKRGRGSIYGVSSSTVYSNKPIFDESEGGFHTYHLIAEGSGKKKSYAIAMETESVKDAPVHYATVDEKGVELTGYSSIDDLKEKDQMTTFIGEENSDMKKEGEMGASSEVTTSVGFDKKAESNIYTYL